MFEKIGFIGLGIMGKPMAKNLLKHGCKLVVFDINQDFVTELTQHGASQATPAEIGAKCNLIFISLPNGPIAKEVLIGENGVATSINPGTIVVDMSSVTPEESQYCAQKLKEKSVSFLDAPVSGGEPKAMEGTLAFMVGGAQEVFDKVKPYFEMMGSDAILIGSIGSGSVTKLANQIIVNLTIAAISEALVLATKAGADPQKVYTAIRTGLAGSTVLDAKAPMIIERNFKPGGKIITNLKDIKNVMSTAHYVDMPLPLTSQLLEILKSLVVSGQQEDDHSGIVKYFERLAGVEVNVNK